MEFELLFYVLATMNAKDNVVYTTKKMDELRCNSGLYRLY